MKLIQVASMVWENILFINWKIDKKILQNKLPPGIELDLFNGEAYISIVPLFMKKVEARFLPILTRLSFFQLNVRTYVKVNGEKGVYFLSLDANNHLAVLGGKLAFKCPYFYSKISYNSIQEKKVFQHKRPKSNLEFEVSFVPYGKHYYPKPTSLESWLTNRTRFFTYDVGNIYYGDVSHGQWKLQHADLTIKQNFLFIENTFPTPKQAPVALYSHSLAVKGYPLAKL